MQLTTVRFVLEKIVYLDFSKNITKAGGLWRVNCTLTDSEQTLTELVCIAFQVETASFLKGTGSPDDFMSLLLRQYFLFYMHIFTLPCEREIIKMCLLASLNPLLIFEDCWESRIRISCFVFPLLSLIFSNVHVIAGFRNTFQNHKRLSEQL